MTGWDRIILITVEQIRCELSRIEQAVHNGDKVCLFEHFRKAATFSRLLHRCAELMEEETTT